MRKRGWNKTQKEYERRKRASGEHVQLMAVIKTPADRALLDRVRRRFPNVSKAELIKRGLQCLDQIPCEEGVFDLKSGKRRDDDRA